MYSSYNSLYTSFLYHSGVKGMKWGIRRKAKGRSVVNAAARVYVRKALIGAAAGMAMSIGYNKVMGNI